MDHEVKNHLQVLAASSKAELQVGETEASFIRLLPAQLPFHAVLAPKSAFGLAGTFSPVTSESYHQMETNGNLLLTTV